MGENTEHLGGFIADSPFNAQHHDADAETMFIIQSRIINCHVFIEGVKFNVPWIHIEIRTGDYMNSHLDKWIIRISMFMASHDKWGTYMVFGGAEFRSSSDKKYMAFVNQLSLAGLGLYVERCELSNFHHDIVAWAT